MDFVNRRRFFVLVLLTGLIGCSRSSDGAASSGAGETDGLQPPAVDNSAAAGRNADPAGSSAKPRGRDEVYVDDRGQKWFGNVPYDVFFENPWAVATDPTALMSSSQPENAGLVETGSGNNSAGAAVLPGATNMAATSAGDFSDAPASSGASAGTSGSPSATTSASAATWSSLISIQILDDEVKTIRNFLNENLQSVGNYNSSMLMIPPKAAALGVLAGVAMEHPESVSWKEDAIYVRDLAKQMSSGVLQRGPKDQRRLLALYEALADTLNRSRPAGLPEPSAGDSFADVSEMRLVMMRMEEAEKRMRTEAGSETAFASKKSMIQHEAAVLGVMSQAVTLPGYGYEDDAEFVSLARTIVESAQAIHAATESGDFSTYELALTKVASTCQNCHSKYKND